MIKNSLIIILFFYSNIVFSQKTTISNFIYKEFNNKNGKIDSIYLSVDIKDLDNIIMLEFGFLLEKESVYEKYLYCKFAEKIPKNEFMDEFISMKHLKNGTNKTWTLYIDKKIEIWDNNLINFYFFNNGKFEIIVDLRKYSLCNICKVSAEAVSLFGHSNELIFRK